MKRELVFDGMDEAVEVIFPFYTAEIESDKESTTIVIRQFNDYDNVEVITVNCYPEGGEVSMIYNKSVDQITEEYDYEYLTTIVSQGYGKKTFKKFKKMYDDINQNVFKNT